MSNLWVFYGHSPWNKARFRVSLRFLIVRCQCPAPHTTDIFYALSVSALNGVRLYFRTWHIYVVEMNYKELSGYYKKSEATGGPPNNEGMSCITFWSWKAISSSTCESLLIVLLFWAGLRDEGKRGRRRNMSARPPPRGGSNFKVNC